ncbi:MAG: hypothetical protein Q8P18_01580 [Pseudomonadota bacterium]|nr:hypothetical protein [Pseudomonadota bacterium]
MLTHLFALALAADPSSPTPPAAPPKPLLLVDISGQYSLWNLQQHNFLLGAEHPLDDAAYTVQNLRIKVGLGRERYGVVARLDAAQGWWGVDNSPTNGYAVTTDDAGTSTTRVYNDDGLFQDKETAYGIHFDLAYGWAAFGPLEVRGGRQSYSVGNKLVLDEDYDGVTVLLRPKGPVGAEAFWAKVSEGKNAYQLPGATLMSDLDDNSDANVFGAKATYTSPIVNAELFGLYYADTIAEDWAWLPQGLGYSRPRFTPQVTTLTTVGLAGNGKLDMGLAWKAEADVLFGEDAIDNADHSGGEGKAGALDRNDGSLFGWNLLADATQTLPLPIGADVGALFGLGSGDEDPTSGAGNVNKLSTMGHWSLTNVWEDSVMPDVEGISPQGLGSPVTRGYRELENTTAIQGRVGVVPHKVLRLESSFTWLQATQPVRGFDATGTPTDTSARDLGWELDANAILTLREGGVVGKVLFGWFQPGEAAGLLINGTADHLDPAWEIKTEAAINF